ncbi:MAG: hypothetical protein GX774_22170 [Armatimonadetes bacterium]|nr:hypothetical protein [Armatimonadota bacterium]
MMLSCNRSGPSVASGTRRVARQGWLPAGGWLAAAILLGVSVACGAAEMPLRPFSYQEGFEGDAPAVAQWASNGESEVHFLGPTEEQAFTGKRSLKLDVTLKSGSYHYWGVPVPVPCLGKLRLSARVRLVEGNTATVGFGANYLFPPSRHSGCAPVESGNAPAPEWKLVECDLVATASAVADAVMATHTGTAQGEDVTPRLDRWAIFITGSAGQRATLYLDDIRIEGEVPDDATVAALTRERWEKGQERFRKRVAGWQSAVAEAEREALPDGELSPWLRDAVARTRATASEARALIEEAAAQGHATRVEVNTIETAMQALRHAPEALRAVAEGEATGQAYLLYTPRAITNDRLRTDLFPVPAPVGQALVLSGCPGEYESATAAVFALQEVRGLRVSATALRGPGGTIPASAVDIRVVKCWFQAGQEIWDLKHKTLVPELLLKDDALVRVDPEKGENYLRSTAPDGTQTYLLCSGPTSEHLAAVRPIDARRLQPVDVAARTLKQFWFTLRIPERAKPGVYTGAVRFQAGRGRRELPLRVTVHPFSLAPSRLRYSIYYRGVLSPDGKPKITSEGKSEAQYRAELADMKAHGVLYPTNYQGIDEVGSAPPSPPRLGGAGGAATRRLRRMLEIRRQVGLPGGPFYNLGYGTGAATDEKGLAELKEGVRRWLALLKPFGYDEVYFYGADEATGERLIAQRAAWRAVQEAGGKSFVAGYHGMFEAMGSLLNCAVLAGKPDPEEALKWHSVRSHVFCYAYPQVGNEEPETYRRNFGLVLWKAGFDGAMDYAYQHAFGHVWNDFDDQTYRDHNFTYPTVNGVVGTLQWEGFREAVDDVRYVTTLERAIARAPAARQAEAQEARRWLDALDPETADLDQTRAAMVEWITRLQAPRAR